MPRITAGDIVTVRCTRALSSGLEVRFGDWIGFLPRSQISYPPPDNLDSFVDEHLECEILEIRREPILSRLKLLEKQRFAEISVGQELSGRVVASMDFGVFVDLGGISGMLHKDDILESHQPPTLMLPIGTGLTVQVLMMSSDGLKIGLKMINTL